MTLKVRRTAAARADIRAISHFIARDNLTAALNWLDKLDEQFATIADVPGIGTDRGYFRPGMRSTPFGNYLIYFEAHGRELIIIAVLHGAQQHERRFKS